MKNEQKNQLIKEAQEWVIQNYDWSENNLISNFESCKTRGLFLVIRNELKRKKQAFKCLDDRAFPISNWDLNMFLVQCPRCDFPTLDKSVLGHCYRCHYKYKPTGYGQAIYTIV